MFIKINSTFPYEGVKYKCMDASDLKRSDACRKCAFRVRCVSDDYLDLDCTRSEREDGKDVYFEELPSPVIRDLITKRSPREMFHRISNYAGKGRYIEYKEEEGGGYGRYELLLRDKSSIYIRIHFIKGEMDWFQVYPSGVRYPANQYYFRKLYIYSKFGKVDKVEFK